MAAANNNNNTNNNNDVDPFAEITGPSNSGSSNSVPEIKIKSMMPSDDDDDDDDGNPFKDADLSSFADVYGTNTGMFGWL